ncbi:hypothetical protein ABIA33_004127 [Streptacidiphilus sp. MAP12-16]|uniref:DUF3566 domain-containing protein n=1 Tax=Streptacidiphilus sp. MAP12-16 TaxID=3156300 RepID=UPI003515801F
MSGATGATGGAGSAAAGRNGPGPSVPPGGAGGGPADRTQGYAQAGRDAGTTSMMPPITDGMPPRAPAVGGGTGGGTAARRRQGGPQGKQATQANQVAAPAPAAPPAPPERSGYSTPTTYQKGQPTPPGGTRMPPGTATPPLPAGSPAAVATGAAVGAPAKRSGPTAGPAAPPSGRTRRARLRVSRTDPWSVMKVSFLLSIALGVVTIVGVSLLWMVLDTAGVFSSLGGTLKQATGSDTSGGFDLQSYLSFGNVLTFTALIAVIDVVLLTALATLGSFIYNTAAGITGGVELTLAEEE